MSPGEIVSTSNPVLAAQGSTVAGPATAVGSAGAAGTSVPGAGTAPTVANPTSFTSTPVVSAAPTLAEQLQAQSAGVTGGGASIPSTGEMTSGPAMETAPGADATMGAQGTMASSAPVTFTPELRAAYMQLGATEDQVKTLEVLGLTEADVTASLQAIGQDPALLQNIPGYSQIAAEHAAAQGTAATTGAPAGSATTATALPGMPGPAVGTAAPASGAGGAGWMVKGADGKTMRDKFIAAGVPQEMISQFDITGGGGLSSAQLEQQLQGMLGQMAELDAQFAAKFPDIAKVFQEKLGPGMRMQFQMLALQDPKNMSEETLKQLADMVKDVKKPINSQLEFQHAAAKYGQGMMKKMVPMMGLSMVLPGYMFWRVPVAYALTDGQDPIGRMLGMPESPEGKIDLNPMHGKRAIGELAFTIGGAVSLAMAARGVMNVKAGWGAAGAADSAAQAIAKSQGLMNATGEVSGMSRLLSYVPNTRANRIVTGLRFVEGLEKDVQLGRAAMLDSARLYNSLIKAGKTADEARSLVAAGRGANLLSGKTLADAQLVLRKIVNNDVQVWSKSGLGTFVPFGLGHEARGAISMTGRNHEMAAIGTFKGENAIKLNVRMRGADATAHLTSMAAHMRGGAGSGTGAATSLGPIGTAMSKQPFADIPASMKAAQNQILAEAGEQLGTVRTMNGFWKSPLGRALDAARPGSRQDIIWAMREAGKATPTDAVSTGTSAVRDFWRNRVPGGIKGPANMALQGYFMWDWMGMGEMFKGMTGQGAEQQGGEQGAEGAAAGQPTAADQEAIAAFQALSPEEQVAYLNTQGQAMQQAAAQSQSMTPEQQASLQEGYRQLTVLASTMPGANQQAAAGAAATGDAATSGAATGNTQQAAGQEPVAHPGTPGA